MIKPDLQPLSFHGKRAIKSCSVLWCPYRTGSAVPSDHQPAGTMNTSIGSGAPLNCGFSMTGDLDKSAPQAARP